MYNELPLLFIIIGGIALSFLFRVLTERGHFRSPKPASIWTCAAAMLSTVLLVGCGGGASKSADRYVPISNSRADLDIAKTLCQAYVDERIGSMTAPNPVPLVSKISVSDEDSDVFFHEVPVGPVAQGWMTPEENEHFINLSRGLRQAQERARKRRTLFCACMIKHGWKCASN